MTSLIYLASPYIHLDKKVEEERFNAAMQITATLMVKGLYVFSPIVHCHPMAIKYSMPTDARYWEKYAYQTLTRCDELYVLKISGWEESLGIRMERKLAFEHGIPISFVTLEGEVTDD